MCAVAVAVATVAGCGGSTLTPTATVSSSSTSTSTGGPVPSGPSGGVGNEPGNPSYTPTAGETVPGSPSETISPTDPGAVSPTSADAGQERAVQGYLEARENQVSSTMKDATAWVDAASPFITARFKATLMEMASSGGSLGVAWQQAHEQTLRVGVEKVACHYSYDAGPVKDGEAVLVCSLIDVVLDASGDPVGVAWMPSLFPYSGARAALLHLLQDGDGSWLVADDWTGRAS